MQLIAPFALIVAVEPIVGSVIDRARRVGLEVRASSQRFADINRRRGPSEPPQHSADLDRLDMLYSLLAGAS